MDAKTTPQWVVIARDFTFQAVEALLSEPKFFAVPPSIEGKIDSLKIGTYIQYR